MNNKNGFFKLAIVSSIGLFAIWVLTYIFGGTGFSGGVNYGYRMGGHEGMMRMMPGYGGSYSYGYGAGNGFGGILSLLLNLLFILFIVGLVVGIFIYIKNNVLTQQDINSIKESFNGNRNQVRKLCGNCNRELNSDWKACPYCGKSSEAKDSQPLENDLG